MTSSIARWTTNLDNLNQFKRALLGRCYTDWIDGPTVGNKTTWPTSLAETEAKRLVRLYLGSQTVAGAATAVREARDVAIINRQTQSFRSTAVSAMHLATENRR